jgi:hypothetical protein
MSLRIIRLYLQHLIFPPMSYVVAGVLSIATGADISELSTSPA